MMKQITVKSLIISLTPMIIAGCNFEKNIDHIDVSKKSGSSGLAILSADASSDITPWIQSEKDSWKLSAVTASQTSLASIEAALNGNTVDVQVSGTGSSILMMQSASGVDLSQYKSGYVEFKIRPKSTPPSAITVSIDNEWPVRSSLVLSGKLTDDRNWQTLAVPIPCMKPFDGAKAVDMSQVKNPFHLDVKEAFNYEISDIFYRESTDQTPVVDPVTCGDIAASNQVNNAPDLVSGDTALFYSGDITQAQDLRSAYPLNSFDVDIKNVNNIVTLAFNGNGGAFLGNDKSNRDLSAHSTDVVTVDMKVTSYGDSGSIQTRIDGQVLDGGTFFSLDNSSLPADNKWYRCQIEVASMINTSSLSSVKKAFVVGGVWDQMNNLAFSFANVAVTKPRKDYKASEPCIAL
ncbi:putative glycoside hydrolase [Vibrio rhizosphaerae]|uniref:Glycoside hydrolase n=1 Tax=Vibrio rhizosphaerae TaxID=398736 RepID=A0ABU4J0A6_9VIBR|nr:putative glycoside hydrolase [Vibrio rhizosphaerae]MDW6093949.1 putative glycoside hydrolase [Vibrio rhizosphaerae]